MDIQGQMKALVAAAVALAATWFAHRFNIKIDTPEIQALLVGVIIHQVTYWVPNK